jgi:5-methylcytosine-specific restriction endonuclease McrA
MPSVTKKAIPRSLKNEVWLAHAGRTFEVKCPVKWCNTILTPFTFEVGHNVPESRGGATVLENLRPLCAQCNRSMGNRYTIDEYAAAFGKGNKRPSPSSPSSSSASLCCLFPRPDPMDVEYG